MENKESESMELIGVMRVTGRDDEALNQKRWF
jgi:hypothetical protein